MTTRTPEAQALDTAYRHFIASAADSGWLNPLRDEAFGEFGRAGLPTPRDEDWKYTNLAPLSDRLLARSGRPAEAPAPGTAEKLLQRLPMAANAIRCVIVDGTFRPELSSELPSVTGLAVEPLSGLADEARDALLRRLGGRIDFAAHRLAALNTAFLADALVIRVASGARLAQPLQVITLALGTEPGAQPRVVVELGEGASLTLIEYHAGEPDSLTNAVTEIHCADRAQLAYYKVQDTDASSFHIASQHLRLDAGSRLDAVHLDLGGALARNDLDVRLMGAGAVANLHGLFVADGERHLDNHTRLEHAAPQTTSREAYRGIIDGRGRGVFNGKIIVCEGADGTDARLSNRNLLLSAGGEINTKPELEIYTDDVKCAHGATTGQLDTDALYYLRTRGIGQDEARRMLTAAFTLEIIERIAIDTIRDHARHVVDGRLPGGAPEELVA